MNPPSFSDPKAAKIDEFWRWFAERADQYVNLKPQSGAWRELDMRVKDMGLRGWEIGPAAAGGQFLAFSPQNDPNKLRTTRRVIARAPSLAGWLFLPAKPPKSWQRKFKWSAAQISVDASSWRFALLRYEDGLIEVLALGDLGLSFSQDEQRKVVEFVVESELGEELMTDAIYRVDVETDPPEELAGASVMIGDLRETVEETWRAR